MEELADGCEGGLRSHLLLLFLDPYFLLDRRLFFLRNDRLLFDLYLWLFSAFPSDLMVGFFEFRVPLKEGVVLALPLSNLSLELTFYLSLLVFVSLPKGPQFFS